MCVTHSTQGQPQAQRDGSQQSKAAHIYKPRRQDTHHTPKHTHGPSAGSRRSRQHSNAPGWAHPHGEEARRARAGRKAFSICMGSKRSTLVSTCTSPLAARLQSDRRDSTCTHVTCDCDCSIVAMLSLGAQYLLSTVRLSAGRRYSQQEIFGSPTGSVAALAVDEVTCAPVCACAVKPAH